MQETFLAGVELVQETSSTNDDCLLAIRAGRLPQHPWLYVANHQSQGRGRAGSRWWSAPGALTFTISLRLEDLAGQSLLSLLSPEGGSGRGTSIPCGTSSSSGAVVLLGNDPAGTAANPTPLSIEWVLEDYVDRLAAAARKAE